MRPLLLLVAIYITHSSNARHLSIGAYAGADVWLHHKSLFQTSNHSWSPGEGLFVRQEGNGRWSHEAGFSHSSYEEGKEYFDDIADGPGYVFVTENFSTRLYAVALKADHRLTKNAHRRFRQYGGFQLRPTLLSQTMHQRMYDSVTRQPAFTNSTVNTTAHNFRVWAGIQYTACYALTSRLTIRAVGAYQIEPIQLWSYHYACWERPAPHGKASIDVGMAYQLH